METDPETVLVFRHPVNHGAVFYRATDELLFALKMVHDEIDVESAASETGYSEHQIRETLAAAQRKGIILL